MVALEILAALTYFAMASWSYFFLVTREVTNTLKPTQLTAYCVMSVVAAVLWPVTIPVGLWLLPNKKDI